MGLLPVVQTLSLDALWGEKRIGAAMLPKSADPKVRQFTEFCHQLETPLRYTLVGQFGYETGREAAQNGLIFAWEHWDRVSHAENPEGYVYRVAKRQAMRSRAQKQVFVVDRPDGEPPRVEPGLDGALTTLTQRQRTVVLLVEGLGMTYEETSRMLGISRSSVQSHLERGLEKLRRELGVKQDV